MEHDSNRATYISAVLEVIMLASPYLKLPEAAAYARVSVRTLQRYLKDGTLNRYGPKGRVLIHRDELFTLLGAETIPQNLEAE